MDRIMAELDSNNTGVTFESFTSFMIKRTKDNDTQEEILESFKSIALDKVIYKLFLYTIIKIFPKKIFFIFEFISN